MKLKSGYPLWFVQSGLLYDYPKLTEDITTEVVIIGGGISGALMAHELIKNNIACVIVDGRTIGLGSTCASTSLLQYQMDISLTDLIDKIGQKKAEQAYQMSVQSIIDIQKISNEIGFKKFKQKDTLFYASYKKHISFIENEYKLHKGLGFDVELWDKNILQEKKFPFSSAGLYSKHSAQTDAYLFTHELLQYNIKKGLRVFDRTYIKSVHDSPKQVELKTENKVKIKGRYLVFATGYESVHFVKKKIVKLISTYAIASEQYMKNEFWYSNCLLWETKLTYLYMRTTDDNRIIVGGRDENFLNPLKRDRLLNKKSLQLASDFKKLFPKIPLSTEFSWTGTFGSTKDGLPYIGNYPKNSNRFFALGFGGNGITFSVTAAKIICDLIRGKKDQSLEELYGFSR